MNTFLNKYFNKIIKNASKLISTLIIFKIYVVFMNY